MAQIEMGIFSHWSIAPFEILVSDVNLPVGYKSVGHIIADSQYANDLRTLSNDKVFADELSRQQFAELKGVR